VRQAGRARLTGPGREAIVIIFLALLTARRDRPARRRYRRTTALPPAPCWGRAVPFPPHSLPCSSLSPSA